ncbi:MAG: valine--tRNA ligase [Flavobacteriaceae bacterium]|nr:valine--tRNA ligase [Flavobacteriaceae bacterium]|tara:strand:- start:13413 stop:16040 length:2628 start_codon:yes stop_codon:yes gene_type:complete
MQIPPKYNHIDTEKKWYSFWMKNELFKSVPNNKEPFTIVIPPPNVTGLLHMGHMLNNTIQDILVRRARMLGKNACWVPGTDHASIATEAKVVENLKKKGINKSDISRDEFLEHAWDWTEKYGGGILEQLKKLGCSCDWDRTKFTLDDDMYESVIQSFESLHEKGLIYRGYRMINWDPEAKTTVSDEEVNYVEEDSSLYFLKYFIENSEVELQIATTRPETIFGDTALCVNPKDERYKDIIGKQAVVPISGRKIPIIADSYVDLEFGTGCLKVTPAHDINDYNLGIKHDLDSINIFDENAILNNNGLHYEGKNRFEVRKEIEIELDSKNLLAKKENYIHNVGRSERTNAVVEPRLSKQWFLKMDDITKPAIKNVLENEKIKFFPGKFKSTYKYWLENIKDWNISRQLSWGHQIPVFYYGNNEKYIVAKNKKEALLKINNESKVQYKEDDLTQDVDVLDTWFSSWLWPISVFDGIRNPNNEEINYYYPTQDLVTGPDIIFFWVARMIISGYEFRDEKPFSNVYFTGIVRDKLRRKMSKQLGNSPDAIKLIEEYGADSVRVGLMLSSAAGNDLLFDESLCQQGKNFTNKIWNALRLVNGWEIDKEKSQPMVNKLGIDWYNNKFNNSLELINKNFENYRISDVLMSSYRLVWDDFCSWLLEILKPDFGEKIDKKSRTELISLFEKNLKILHPFMPFLTEEIYHNLPDINNSTPLTISNWPEMEDYNQKSVNEFETTKEIISQIRNYRKEKNISFKTSLDLYYLPHKNSPKNIEIIKKIASINKLEESSKENFEMVNSFIIKNHEFFIPLDGGFDKDAEIEKLKKELDYNEGFLKSVENKLKNENFVKNAPDAIVKIEKQKVSDTKSKIKSLQKSISELR